MPSDAALFPGLIYFKLRVRTELHMACCRDDLSQEPLTWHVDILLDPDDDDAASGQNPTRVGWMRFVAVDEELVDGDPYAALDAVSQEYAPTTAPSSSPCDRIRRRSNSTSAPS